MKHQMGVLPVLKHGTPFPKCFTRQSWLLARRESPLQRLHIYLDTFKAFSLE